MIEGVDDVTPAVISAMSKAPNARLRQLSESFVRHIHAFAREVKLTETEYEIGIDFLNRIGKATTDAHNEGVLFVDAIGLSTLVCLQNNGDYGATETTSSLLGPFWRQHSPRTENGGSIVRSPTPGPELFVSCLFKDVKGSPIPGVEVDVWQASPVGLYENQDDSQADMNLRGKLITDVQGRLQFRSVKPAAYPVPTDGPVGDMLRLQQRHPYRSAHLHFLGCKPGYKTLVSQIFPGDDEYLDTDVVFGATRHLIANFKRHDSGSAPTPGVQAPWYTLEYTFVMESGESKLPAPPIK